MSLRNDSQNAASIEYSFHKWSIKVFRYGDRFERWICDPQAKYFATQNIIHPISSLLKKLLYLRYYASIYFYYYYFIITHPSRNAEWKLTNFCSFLKITTPKINSRNSTSNDIHIISSYNMKYLVHDREPVKPIARICADTCSATSRNEWF